MRILFLTTVLPAGERTGGEVVSQSLVGALRAGGHDVSVLGYRRPGDPERSAEQCVGRRPIETADARARSFAWMARALAGREPYSSAKYRSRAYASAVRAAIAQRPDVVVVDHAQLHFLLGVTGRSAPPAVLVAHNAEAALYRGLATRPGARGRRWLNAREGRLLERVEADLARRCAQVWTLSDRDADQFRSLAPAADVRTLEVASPFAEPAPPRPAAFDVGLLGSWSWEANRAGLEWFLDEVVPQLPGEMTVEVAGAGSELARGRHANVVARGVVGDARSFLAAARVVAVPALTGGGVQIKTLDAIASGLPVVATPAAARGLSAPPASVAVAEGAGEFARALVRLAGAGERERLRAEALAWSNARRERLESTVNHWIGELADAGDVPVALEAQGNAARTG